MAVVSPASDHAGMTCDDWLAQFENELKKLRPHVRDRLARTL